MHNAKCSVRSVAGSVPRLARSRRPVVSARTARDAAFVGLVALTAFASRLSGQQPVLRIGDGSELVRGTMIDGAAAYPARTLEELGFRVADVPSGLVAVIGGDTLHFWNTSPYFRTNHGVHQLAFAAADHDGAMHLPEQFFIQWLPTTYPDRFEYRSGVLLERGRSVTTVAQTTKAAAKSKPRPARVVVIDPGHGGRDPGKVGRDGLRESDITLTIAKRLAVLLEERGYEVHLTRTTDTYVSLPERPRLANEWKGDRPVALFLSIHANSAPTSAAKGFETFFLSDARTDDERRVAEMENEAIHFDDHPPAAADDGLDRILNTLRSDFLMRASHDLASAVQEELADFHPGPNRGVKRAGFYVLVGAIMPAVLIETAFMSNREESRLLGTQAFQRSIAGGIADSVDEFFRRNAHLWEEGS